MSTSKKVRLIVDGEFQLFSLGTWVVCAECLRCYQLGEYRSMLYPLQEESIEWCRCPYSDCGGEYPLDAIPWASYSENTSYPAVPVREQAYIKN